MNHKEFTIKKDVRGFHVFLKETGDYLFTTDTELKTKNICKALEKQIPVKAIKTGTEFKALDVEAKKVVMYECFPCPMCGKWISKIYKYCEHCGQMIEEA